METYSLQGDAFIIRDYDRQSPFTSFLPGLAGIKGIPMWSFYVNRGQAVTSFGIHNKGNAMMEFNPANAAYETTQLKGFRTFLRVDGAFCEPFFRQEEGVRRVMEIRRNTLTISEERDGLKLTVTYFVLPREDLGAMVRRVKLENTGSAPKQVELLDGMPQVIPYGITLDMYKGTGNLFKSWTDIINQEENAPIFKMRASGDDSAEVREITGGWFYTADCGGEALPVIVDRNLIFGTELSLMEPLVFEREGLDGVLEKAQCFANKMPCAFVPLGRELAPREAVEFTAAAGYAAAQDHLNRKAAAFREEGYWDRKQREAEEIADQLTASARTATGDKVFDQYVEQCYLDNFLRGGVPFVFGEGEDKRIVHLFSRKHGDPERDYNFFSIAGEYYSQGNGNYRDVCQNRRHDVFFHPEIGDFDVFNFFSLVQLDGYNPLEIRPSTFAVRDRAAAEQVVGEFIAEGAGPVLQVLEGPFTPGQITNAIAEYGLTVAGDEEDLVSRLLLLSEQWLEAGFGEGYWSDHFDYDLDLIEDYLSVWPDKKQELLLGRKDYRIYDSVGVVRSRSDTYVLGKNGPRQYGAIRESEEKAALPGFDPKGANWVKDARGKTVTTTLLEKLLILAGNKFALLDNEGLGLEMEGGKPGWNDAMNGLPGLFGSSMAETLELRRVVDFLKGALAEQDPLEGLPMLREFAAFLRAVAEEVRSGADPFTVWDRTATLREAYRKETELGVSGERTALTFGELAGILETFSARLEDAVCRALDIGGGIMPTFFTYEAVDFEEVKNDDGTPFITPYGLPGVKVKAFRRVDLPVFLEGPARYLSSCGPADRENAAVMAAKLKKSELYDEKLQMYKTSASIEGESMEVGRVRAFTPGWLERESVFLHMEYKYLVGLLKAGLVPQFFEAMDGALIPYQDPAVYGRSILENSSFIASSVNPDPAVHGKGFQARLSGSTVETLAMWKGMFMGGGGFEMRDGELAFRFAPVLPGRLFDENGEAGFTLCGTCAVTYRNESRRDTFGENAARVRSITVWLADKTVTVQGDTLNAELAAAVREHRAEKILAVLG